MYEKLHQMKIKEIKIKSPIKGLKVGGMTLTTKVIIY